MPTIRENHVYIFSNEIENISYIPDSLHVSEGQPKESQPIIRKQPGAFMIVLHAGRHKTREVADTFISASGGEGHLFSPFSIMDTKPQELNFCFGLEIHWKTGKTSRCYLGQGSTMGRNNWWVGSDTIAAFKGNASIEVDGETYRLSGYDTQSHATATNLEQVEARAVPPALQELLLKFLGKAGEKLLQELANLIQANVNSFRITK